MRNYAVVTGALALAVIVALWVVDVRVAKAPNSDNFGVKGTVSLGPTCPVQRIPPDPACADRPYATTIVVRRAGSSATFATGKSDATGAFRFSLLPGAYTLSVSGGTMLPRCSPVDVTVSASGYVAANISCDTGIR